MILLDMALFTFCCCRCSAWTFFNVFWRSRTTALLSYAEPLFVYISSSCSLSALRSFFAWSFSALATRSCATVSSILVWASIKDEVNMRTYSKRSWFLLLPSSSFLVIATGLSLLCKTLAALKGSSNPPEYALPTLVGESGLGVWILRPAGLAV